MMLQTITLNRSAPIRRGTSGLISFWRYDSENILFSKAWWHLRSRPLAQSSPIAARRYVQNFLRDEFEWFWHQRYGKEELAIRRHRRTYRISVWEAILADPKFLMLDEATSNWIRISENRLIQACVCERLLMHRRRTRPPLIDLQDYSLIVRISPYGMKTLKWS